MTDFRTATTERRVQNRLTYLETLASAPGLAQDAREKLLAAMAEHQAVLDSLREESVSGSRVSMILPLPTDVEVTFDAHAYPVYVPPIRVLQQWKMEARLGFEAHGDHRDEHRRITVLMEVVEDLLRILAEEEVKLTPLPQPVEAVDSERPVTSISTDVPL